VCCRQGSSPPEAPNRPIPRRPRFPEPCGEGSRWLRPRCKSPGRISRRRSRADKANKVRAEGGQRRGELLATGLHLPRH